MKSMPNEIRQEVLRRLEDRYELKRVSGTQYLRKGKCPACSHKELYSRQDEPWFIKCGRRLYRWYGKTAQQRQGLGRFSLYSA